MTKIFKVLSNIRHNGEDIKKDSFIQEFAGANELETNGALKFIAGAETIEEAQDIDAEEIAQAKEQEGQEVAAPNTWEAKKEEEVTEKTEETDTTTKPEDEEYNGPMEYYKVVGEVHPLDEDGIEKEEVLEVGSIHYLPKGAVDTEDGLWEVATEEEIAQAKESSTVVDGVDNK